MSIAYCLMCFTQLALDAEARYNMGYLLVAITIKNIIVNIFIVGSQPARMCKLRCKKRWQRRHLIKEKWRLRAQRTKDFFKRTFTRRKPIPVEGSTTGEQKQLSIIEENMNEESMDSEELEI